MPKRLAAQSSEAATSTATTVPKTSAAREALAAGIDSPAEALKWIRDKFGCEMTPTHFSAIKARDKSGTRPKDRTNDVLCAMEVLKPYVASLGPDVMKQLVDLMA